ncbi:hypothetical protein Tco_0331979 [Tanacetum coccineum]
MTQLLIKMVNDPNSLVLSFHASDRISLDSAKSLVEPLDLYNNCDILELDSLEVVEISLPFYFPKQYHSLDNFSSDLHDTNALPLNCIIVLAFHLQLSVVKLHQLPLIFLLIVRVILLQ